MTDYAPGTPSWVDLSSSDADAAAAFYGELFGWSATPPGEEFGGYRTFIDGDDSLAGLMPLMSPEQPVVWSTYVSVDDADATAVKVKEAGGQVMVEPMDVGDLGRMAVFVDTVGAVIGVWQPGEHKGATKVNTPVSLSWNELACRDADAAKAFYGAVFGWVGDTADMGGMAYTQWMLGDKSIGGMLEMAGDMPAGIPPNWLVYFAVEDTDATLAKALELGGGVIREPMDLPVGRFAVMTDPQGAPFAVIASDGS
jgi:predicted enzyme related to lactoylglutathione lyase